MLKVPSTIADGMAIGSLMVGRGRKGVDGGEGTVLVPD